MLKKKEKNFHTRDLFLETLVKLGGQYLIRSEVSTDFDIKFKFSECRFMANANFSCNSGLPSTILNRLSASTI